MIEISVDLSEDNISSLFFCLSKCFNYPTKFLDIVENLIVNPLTVVQRKDFLSKMEKEVMTLGKGFN